MYIEYGIKMVQSLGAILFMMFYLGTLWFFLGRILLQNLRQGTFSQRDLVWKWTLTAYFLLGVGDIFHLGSRIFVFFAPFNMTTEFAELLVETGSIITGITVTYFYIALLHMWKHSYGKHSHTPQKIRAYFIIAYATFIARVLLLLLSYNQWSGGDETTVFGFITHFIPNVPVYVIGFLTIGLLLHSSKLEKTPSTSGIDQSFNQGNFKAALWFIVSYVMFTFTVVLVGAYPIAGIFMIPKTIAYLLAFFYHYTTILTQ